MNDTRLLNVRQIWSQIHTIVSISDTFPLYAPTKNVKYILACFVQAVRTGNGISPVDFSDGFTKAANGASIETRKANGAVAALQ